MNRRETEMIAGKYERLAASGKQNLSECAIFCFVILTTQEFEKRMANFYKPGRDINAVLQMIWIGRLNIADMKEIRETILTTGTVDRRLKELTGEIVLE